MSAKVRCIEGHVFDKALGACPRCGWPVPTEAPPTSLVDRLRKSIPQAVGALFPEANPQLAPANRMPRPLPAYGLALLRSRTILVIAGTLLAIGYLIVLTSVPYAERVTSGDRFIDEASRYVVVIGLIVVAILLFAVRQLLRSTVPLTLVVAVMAAEWLLLKPAFWIPWATFWRHVIPSRCWQGEGCGRLAPRPETGRIGELAAFLHPSGSTPFPPDLQWLGEFVGSFFAAGLTEDILKILPVAGLMAVAWALGRVPLPPSAAAIRDRFRAWADLDRSTSLLMLAFASGAVFVLDETLGQYFSEEVKGHSRWNVVFLASLPITSPRPPWEGLVPLLASSFGFDRGLVLITPRTLATLTGHGAFAAVAGYYLARARWQPWPTAIGLMVLGLTITASLHSGWNTFAPARAELRVPLALAAFFLLYAVCLQAIEMDRRAGFLVEDLPLGASISPATQPPPFPLAPAKHRSAEPPAQEGEADRPVPAAPPAFPVPELAAPPPAPMPAAAVGDSPAPAREARIAGTLLVAGTATSPGRRIPLAASDEPASVSDQFAVEVAPAADDRDGLDLINRGSAPWQVTETTGGTVAVAPGARVRLAAAHTIACAGITARVQLALA